MRRDPVTPELRERVLQLDDHKCAARLIVCRDANHAYGPDGLCSFPCSGRLTLDHVKGEPRMGKRAPSDERHLVTLCEHHHLHTRWATSHRPELREYLRRHRP